MALSREEEAMRYFVSKGWTTQQAAGIVGNLSWESGGLSPSIHEKGNTQEGYGLAQWGPARQQEFARVYGKSIQGSSFQEQLDFVQYELTQGEYKNAGRALANTTSSSEAALVVRQRYEKPKESLAHDSERIANARRLEQGDYREFEPAVKKPIFDSQGNPVAGTSAANPATVISQDPRYTIASKDLKPFDPALSGIGSNVEIFGAGQTKQKTRDNILNQFSSYNYIITISCLPPKQVNFPDAIDSYKNSQLGKIILRSGGGIPDNASVETGFRTPYNPKGKFEYYIDDITMELLATYTTNNKGTNASTITFTVIEPYSMGIFLQTLELASTDAGYFNYRTAPYLMTIEFIGYDETGNVVPVDDELNRHIPFNITAVDMSVRGSGSKYDIKATPWNEIALTDMNNVLKEDMSISGTSVAELLQTGENSLQKWINTKLQHIAITGTDDNSIKSTPNEVVIMFPKTLDSKNGSMNSIVEDSGQPLTKSSTKVDSNQNVESKLTLKRGSSNMLAQESQTLNEIGVSTMGYTNNTGGFQPVTNDNAVQTDPNNPINRKSIYYKDDRAFHFPQGTSIIAAIEEIVLMSEYCKQRTSAGSMGMIKWFRIETQVYILEPTDTNIGRGMQPKLMVYKVVPYLVHESVFATPTSAPPGYEQLRNEAAKEYNYIYTGKNLDILDLNISFKSSAFLPISADQSKFPQAAYPQSLGVGFENPADPVLQVNSAKQKDSMMGSIEIGSLISRYKNSGGGPPDDYRALVAKSFHLALLESQTDNTSIQMDIMGDPYYLADSGMGNFSDEFTSFNLTKNGSINYQSGQVDFILNYKTPVDYNPETGILEDSAAYTTYEGFSGLYTITHITTTFSRGKFTQNIAAYRRPNQEPIETTDEKIGNTEIKDEGLQLACSVENAKKPSTNAKEKGVSESVLGLELGKAKDAALTFGIGNTLTPPLISQLGKQTPWR